MDTLGRWALRVGAAAHTALRWLVYCVVTAVVGGTLVYVLVAEWLGLPTRQLLSRVPVSLSPELVAVAVLVVLVVVLTDLEDSGLVRNELPSRAELTTRGPASSSGSAVTRRDGDSETAADGSESDEAVESERESDTSGSETDVATAESGSEREPANETEPARADAHSAGQTDEHEAVTVAAEDTDAVEGAVDGPDERASGDGSDPAESESVAGSPATAGTPGPADSGGAADAGTATDGTATDDTTGEPDTGTVEPSSETGRDWLRWQGWSARRHQWYEFAVGVCLVVVVALYRRLGDRDAAG